MKTTKLLFLGALGLMALFTNAQVTQATNTITAGSYVGTSNAFDVVFKRQAVAAGLLSATTTSFGVNSLSMPSSVSLGVSAGQYSSGSGFNTYIGQNAGKGSSIGFNSGTYNTFVGNGSGSSNTTGSYNILLGSRAVSAIRLGVIT